MTSVSSAAAALTARHRGEIDAVVDGALPPGPVALINFPNHRNAGDMALWLAARSTLRRLGREVRYQCAWNGFSHAALRRRVGSGPIVINAGGNFGDLYAGQQGLREEVLAVCRDNPIVQLPQSIWFRDPRNLERVQRLVDDHGNVTVLCRDARSLDLAKASFNATIEACPDLALGLDPVARPSAPTADILWLARTDPEKAVEPLKAEGVDVVDWLALAPGEGRRAGAPPVRWWLTQAALAGSARSSLAASIGWRAAAQGFEAIASAWVDRGRRFLSRGRVVITDRLHAHILAIEMGVPTVVLDSSYGKVHAVARECTLDSGLTHVASSAAEALTIARGLIEEEPACAS